MSHPQLGKLADPSLCRRAQPRHPPLGRSPAEVKAALRPRGSAGHTASEISLVRFKLAAETRSKVQVAGPKQASVLQNTNTKHTAGRK
jgi:hypothetical protein